MTRRRSKNFSTSRPSSDSPCGRERFGVSVLIWIVGFTLLGGVLSALAASLFLLADASLRRRLVPHLISFATGALLGAALLGLLPHAIEGVGPERVHGVGLTVLLGILLFFVLEKLVLWRHCHHDDCEAHATHDDRRDAASATMVLVGDGLHNLIDGVLISAAFLTDVSLGIVTSLAVIAHEIPQEVGEVAVLLNGGMSRVKALTYNVLISLTTVVGGVVAYVALDEPPMCCRMSLRSPRRVFCTSPWPI